MSDLAPRALRDCAPSALSAGGGRPLNFTVRFLGNRFRKPLCPHVFVATITYAHHLGPGQAH